MKSFNITALSGALLAAGSLFSGAASASLIGAQTATVNFQGVATATFGWANVDPTIATSPTGGTFNQNNVVVGVVKDPTDSGAHFHQAGTIANRLAQYHPDSTGIYVRLADASNFSLQSLFLSSTTGQTGGNYVIYGYQNAFNDLLGAGTPDPNDPLNYYLDNADVEGGNVAPVASYTFANDGTQNGTVNLAQLQTQDVDWSNIAAFWITFQGFNNSPTTHYWYDALAAVPTPAYPDWSLLADNIVLGAAVTPAAVPVPGAVWLFATGLLGLTARDRRKMAA